MFYLWYFSTIDTLHIHHCTLFMGYFYTAQREYILLSLNPVFVLQYFYAENYIHIGLPISLFIFLCVPSDEVLGDSPLMWTSP